ncbi:hypothetical protein [Nitrosospira sp. NRS527]|uniref:hypothetical protein n=1 Tax=Nitrosospira sp. NRS527 TaxID=155925 RepID=UPI001BCDB6F1|nr:hypothetical protein [Nitrosospira sp. NRS527]
MSTDLNRCPPVVVSPWGCRCGRTAYHGDGRADRCTGAASVVRSDVTDRLALRNLGVTGVVQLLARGVQVEMYTLTSRLQARAAMTSGPRVMA